MSGTFPCFFVVVILACIFVHCHFCGEVVHQYFCELAKTLGNVQVNCDTANAERTFCYFN